RLVAVPAASVPALSVTEPPPGTMTTSGAGGGLPFERGETPNGKEFVTITPVAELGPALETVMTLVYTPPTKSEAGTLVTATVRSATGLMEVKVLIWRLQPELISPASPVESSKTNNFHAPLASLPARLARAEP